MTIIHLQVQLITALTNNKNVNNVTEFILSPNNKISSKITVIKLAKNHSIKKLIKNLYLVHKK